MRENDTTEPTLTLRDVTIDFGGLRAVDGLGFYVRPGQIVSLIGPNGAGKTTVLNSISGFVTGKGSIRYREHELMGRPAHRRSSLGIARTFQNMQLFGGMTLLDNVTVGQYVDLGGNVLTDMLRVPALARENSARARSLEILGDLGLEQYTFRTSDSLPFGVQKLAGVARALAAGPSLLLMDEPAAGLNHLEATRLGESILRWRDERSLTILLVEHNMRLVMGISDHIVVMDQGEKLSEGSAAVVRDDPAVVAAYLGSAVGSVEIGVRNEFAEDS